MADVPHASDRAAYHLGNLELPLGYVGIQLVYLVPRKWRPARAAQNGYESVRAAS